MQMKPGADVDSGGFRSWI